MRKITVEVNGIRKDLTEVFIREFFHRGIIGPETRIWRNGVEMRLMDAPDLMQAPPNYSSSGSSDGSNLGSSADLQPAAPPFPDFGGSAYNRTYNPDAGRADTPEQTNRFAIFLWVSVTALLLFVVAAFIVYKTQNREPSAQTVEETETQRAEEAYEQAPEDLGDATDPGFEDILAPSSEPESAESNASESETTTRGVGGTGDESSGEGSDSAVEASQSDGASADDEGWLEPEFE